MKWVMLMAMLAGACVQTTRTAGRTMSKPFADPPGALALRTARSNGVVVITAAWPRMCHRTVTDTIETVTTFTQLPLFDPKRTSRTEAAGSISTDCQIPAISIPIHVTFPSGLEVDGQTDDRGELVVVLPAGEDRGDIRARGEASAPVDAPIDQLTSDPPPAAAAASPEPPAVVSQRSPPVPARAGFGGVRDALQRCAARFNVDGVITIALVIDPSGRINNVTLDLGGEQLAACVRTEIATVMFMPSHDGRTIAVPFKIFAPRP